MRQSQVLLLGTVTALLVGCAAQASAPRCGSAVKPYGVEVVDYDENENYLALMMSCAEEGTENALTLGAIYEEQRNIKLESEAIETARTSFFSSLDAEQIRRELAEYSGEEVSEEPYAVYYGEEDAVLIARLLYSECRGVASITEQACVAWVVLNRADSQGKSVHDVLTAQNQFAYRESAPVLDELLWLAEDVLSRWNDEKNGKTDVGRVLPAEYQWFSGDGTHNYFRNAYKGKYQIWDYQYDSPYES